MGLSDFIGATQLQNLVTTGINSAVSRVADRTGIDLGASSPQANARPAVGGTPTQAVQPVYKNGNQWFQKPIVLIGAAVAVAVLLWALLRKK